MVKEVYLTSNSFPKDELYGITNQMRRASVSIPANIAEGCGRSSDKEMVRFLDIANGSAFELQTLVLLCLDLNLISVTDFNSMDLKLEEIQKMIFGLKQSVKK